MFLVFGPPSSRSSSRTTTCLIRSFLALCPSLSVFKFFRSGKFAEAIELGSPAISTIPLLRSYCGPLRSDWALHQDDHWSLLYRISLNLICLVILNSQRTSKLFCSAARTIPQKCIAPEPLRPRVATKALKVVRLLAAQMGKPAKSFEQQITREPRF